MSLDSFEVIIGENLLFNRGKSRQLDVSRFRAAPGSHLGCYTFKSQGAFPA